MPLARAAIAILLLAGVARADDAAMETARAHYRAGQAYFRQGDLARALREFQAARLDDARPELDYNIALTCDKLGDAAGAIDAYRRYLAARPTDELHGEIEARLSALERAVGELVVVSRVPGASVTVDGVAVPPARLGAPLRVNVGPHEIVASKEPLLPQRRVAQVSAGQHVEVAIDPRDPERRLDRRAKLGIGLGVGGAAIVIAGVALGVYFGTHAPSPFDPGGAAGIVTVRPALGVRW